VPDSIYVYVLFSIYILFHQVSELNTTNLIEWRNNPTDWDGSRDDKRWTCCSCCKRESILDFDQINKQFIIQFLQNRTIAYICFLFSILYGWMQLCQYKNKFHLCDIGINLFLYICVIVIIYWLHIQISNYLY
jgi:hypothetical protein